MSDRPSSRIGAAAGLAFVLLAFVGNAIATSGSTVDEHSGGAELLRDLQAHHGAAFHVGAVMELLAFLALLAFVAYVAALVRRAEGDGGWLWLTALGGGVLTIAIKLGSAAPMLAAVWRVDDLDATTARTLVDLNSFAFFISFATLAMFVGCASAVALRTALLPRWLAAGGVVVAVAQVATMTIGLTSAPILPYLLTAIWIAAVSVVLTRRAGSRRTAAASRAAAAAA